MALWRRGRPNELLHPSDQGNQYTSEDFQRLLADQGIICRMSRMDDVWDNSAMESFFSSLRRERVSRRWCRSRNEARADPFNYIERFYNPRRGHSRLGNVSPMDYELRFNSEANHPKNRGEPTEGFKAAARRPKACVH
jgi:putative transposase